MKKMKHWLMQEILINNSSEHNIIQNRKKKFPSLSECSVKNENGYEMLIMRVNFSCAF